MRKSRMPRLFVTEKIVLRLIVQALDLHQARVRVGSRRAKYIVVALAALFTCSWLAGIRFVLTPSVPVGMWLIQRGVLADRGYTEMCLPPAVITLGRRYFMHGSCPGEGAPVMKHVAALPGDIVKVTAEALSVNGIPMPRSARIAFDHAHQAIPTRIGLGDYFVTPGQMWLLGDEDRSYDSRYFGPVPIPAQPTVAYPILVYDKDAIEKLELLPAHSFLGF